MIATLRKLLKLEPKRWKLLGYDTFASDWYPLGGAYRTEEAAVKAARRRLKELERSQPSENSGGQDGIQDQVYIKRPDGSTYRQLLDGPRS
jgi:hypothetical protein